MIEIDKRVKNNLKKEMINARILKNNGSWFYCDKCDNTIGYLVYSTYNYFDFDFTCKCGNIGKVSLKYDTNETTTKSDKKLILKKNRFCCPNDESPLFTVVQKHISEYSCKVGCFKCNEEYSNV